MTCTIEQTVALVLGIHIEPRKGRPWWVRKQGAIVRELAPVAEHGTKQQAGEPAPIELSEAISISLKEVKLSEPSAFMTIPAVSSRAMLYVLLESDLMRQAKIEGHEIWTLMGTVPQDGMEIIMAQMKNCAVDIGQNKPTALVASIQHLCALSLAYWEWSQNWFATLQRQQPADQPGARIFTFPAPTGKIEEPEPLKPLEEKKAEPQPQPESQPEPPSDAEPKI